MQNLINFEGDLTSLLDGIQMLEPHYNFKNNDNGVPVKVKKVNGNLRVTFVNGSGQIEYNERIHFFRALSLFLEAYQKNDTFNIVETPQFKTNGVMVDCSRNAVLRVKTIYELLRYMSVMGLNMLMLYTEDTYTIEDEPFFGYLRGRYTSEEIKAIDDYAYKLGIEVIPCIQTLGHLSMVLKWPEYNDIKDNESVLLVKEEKTYELIEKMIKASTKPLRSKRIHLGMDETHGLGRGQYLEKQGYHDTIDIFNYHLGKILDITQKYKLKPMIWSDSYIKAVVNEEQGLDDDSIIINEEITADDSISESLQFVYWDYFTKEKQEYHENFQAHMQLGNTPIFAGGVIATSSFSANSIRTFESTIPALKAAKEEGIEEVFATIWGDDGNEYHPFTTLLGVQLYAEMGYSNDLDMEKLRSRIKFCTGIDYQAFIDLSMLDTLEEVNQENRWAPNVSKYVFWQDPLLGLYDKDIEDLNLNNHYIKVYNLLNERFQSQEEVKEILAVPLQLSYVLSIKSEIGNRMKNLYEINNKDGLARIVSKDLPELINRIKEMRKTHRKQWMKLNKPFGWEVLDLRYSGLIGRIESTIYRLELYLNDKIEQIEELEEEKLYLDRTEKGLGNGIWRKYKLIATPNVLLE